jgi:hypothetical protein
VSQESDFFKANGPATFAFETLGTHIGTGGRFSGNDLGVVGFCDKTTGLESVGVRGEGKPSPSPSAATVPGTGVLGKGGQCDATKNTSRILHGAGVIGVAGARPAPGDSAGSIPSNNQTGHVGVFGVGGDGERRGSQGGGAARSGPMVSGPGVLGHGGHYRNILGGDPEESEITGDGPGVVGYSGTMDVPEPLQQGIHEYEETLQVGVFGKGRQAGVKGLSPHGRGGVFGSTVNAAQVQLQPLLTDAAAATAEVALTDETVLRQTGASLPKSGQGGDLFATKAKDGTSCMLWFCESGQTENSAASWRQVLMGPAFLGTV